MIELARWWSVFTHYDLDLFLAKAVLINIIILCYGHLEIELRAGYVKLRYILLSVFVIVILLKFLFHK